MGYKNGFYAVRVDVKRIERFDGSFCTDADIDEYSVIAAADIGAVSAAPAEKRANS